MTIGGCAPIIWPHSAQCFHSNSSRNPQAGQKFQRTPVNIAAFDIPPMPIPLLCPPVEPGAGSICDWHLASSVSRSTSLAESSALTLSAPRSLSLSLPRAYSPVLDSSIGSCRTCRNESTSGNRLRRDCYQRFRNRGRIPTLRLAFHRVPCFLLRLNVPRNGEDHAIGRPRCFAQMRLGSTYAVLPLVSLRRRSPMKIMRRFGRFPPAQKHSCR